VTFNPNGVSLEDIPSILPYLSVSERERLLAELDKLGELKAQKQAQLRFLPFVKEVWPTFIGGKHHKIMAEAFERVANGTCKRLIINLAPRHPLSVDEKILTTSGWKTMGSVQPGDYVFGPDGLPTLVVGKSETHKNRELYEVETDDGAVVTCDGDHRWLVCLERKTKIFREYTADQLWQRDQGARLYPSSRGVHIAPGRALNPRAAKLPPTCAVQLPEVILPIDPYVLGVWLGDGTSAQGVITSHDADSPQVRAEFARRGYATTDQTTRMTFGVLGLKVKLRDLGVLGDKHIPEAYFLGSEQQRLDLVRGLMDTDGNVSAKGQCFFAQKSLRVVDGFRRLLWSLGVKNSLQTNNVTLNGKDYGVHYKVSFYMKGCATLPRKADRTFNGVSGRFVRFRKTDRTGDTVCIEVAREDHLFLVGEGMVPTLNTKSEFASYLLPAWFLGKFPNKKIIQISHTAELAVGFGRKVRNLVDTEVYHRIFPELGLQADSKAAGRWNTSKGGDYFAIGIGGAVTGKGADLLIIDDPHSEQEAAIAETNPDIYDKTYEWYTSGPRQRLQPGAAIIIVQTRWSKRDLTGQVLKAAAQRGGEDWEVIELPAILPSGAPIWPEFWSLEELTALKEELPNSKWQAQYQQSPTSETSAIIKREWWKTWESEKPPKCEFVLMSWDTAFEKSQRSDFSALTTWGVFYQPDATGEMQANIILLNAFRERMEFPRLKQVAIDQYKEWEPDGVIIEKKASGAPLIYELRAMGIPVQEFTPSKGNDKISRLNAVSDVFASGRVWAPNTHWADEVINEVAEFPAGEHDDFCFVAGTLIATPKGPVPIEAIQPGDKVITPLGVQRVLSSGCTGVRPVVTRFGLTGTGNHPVYTLDSGWKNLDTVCITDTLSRFTPCDMMKLRHPKQLSLMGLSTDVWAVNAGTTYPKAPLTAVVKALKGSMWLFGSTMLGLWFRQGMKSTTSTATRSTLNLRTSKAFQRASTAVCQKYIPILRHSWNIWRLSARSLLHGISLKPVVCGIGSTVSLPSLRPEPLGTQNFLSQDPPVRGAGAPQPRKTAGRSSALLTAEVPTTGTLPGSAKPCTPTSQPVFNLTVENVHCYYANGILVHNCDSTSMAVMRFRKGGYLRTDLDEPDVLPSFRSKRAQGYY